MILAREYYEHFSKSRHYSGFLILISFSLMVTGLIPFEVVLIPCVVATPLRWKKIVLYSMLGSAFGAVVLAAFFTVYGRQFLNYFFPSMQASKNWIRTEGWIDQYGIFALIGIAALPIAQLPAIAFCGLMKMNLFELFLSFLAGKSIKYGLIAYGTSKAERRVHALNK